jgi:hypothetical protein
MANTVRDGGGGTRYIELQAARWARKPIADLFSSWTKIRVGIRCDVTSTANFTPTEFFMGLCSGTTDIPGDTTPLNAVGIRSVPAGLWTYQTSGGTAYNQMYVAAFKSYKIVNGVQTAGLSSGALAINTTNNIHANGPACGLFVTITKGSPNYTLELFRGDWGFSFGMTKAQFDAQIIATTPTVTNHITTGSLTIAFDETAGTLDTACLYFSDTTIIRVHDWAVVKLA